MADTGQRWDPARRADAYAELEHPSDLFLEIHGRDLCGLVENALFAFYDQIARLEGFEVRRELTLSVSESALDEALRALLSEALFRFDTEGFVAVSAEVTVEQGADIEPAGVTGAVGTAPGARGAVSGDSAPGWRLRARLWGDDAQRGRHTLLHEVKAVTYHRLAVQRTDGGWKATVLLDI